MLRSNLIPALAAALGFFVLAAAPATAQGNCEWYAKTALKQQLDNQRMRCGFTGDSWSSDLRAHRAWCASVAPNQWKAEAQKRDQLLAQCAAKK